MSQLSPEERYSLYKEIEKRVRKRIDRRKEFFSHLAAYLVGMIGVWGFWLNFHQFGEGFWGAAAGLVTVGWTMGIIIHFVQFWLDEMGEREIDAELEKAGLRTPRAGKSKREEDDYDERMMRLGKDGELEEIEDDFYDEAR